jgi:hypothetical protein
MPPYYVWTLSKAIAYPGQKPSALQHGLLMTKTYGLIALICIAHRNPGFLKYGIIERLDGRQGSRLGHVYKANAPMVARSFVDGDGNRQNQTYMIKQIREISLRRIPVQILNA